MASSNINSQTKLALSQTTTIPHIAAERREAPDQAPSPALNALGRLLEERLADPASPCRTYAELSRRSGLSRESLSRYVTLCWG